jgi:anaerobic magnesium-protoporphyrin IX monomethyl ester cyclase
MYITFLIPPVLPGKKAAERSAGCTNVVYPMPNIYELIVAAMVEQMGHIVRYRDFVMEKSGQKEFLDFLENDDSKIYFFWTVNLSLESDAVAAQKLRQVNRNALVVFLGPGATYFPEKLLLDERCIIVRGEPENTVLELVTAVNEDSNWRSLDGITWLKADSPERNSSRPLIRDLDQLPFPARHLI